MTYQEAIDYLFTATPVFQKDGGSAYKPGLERTEALSTHYGHPHRAYPCIHVGGTNGKGSTSHTLAAILQQAGYRVGLFTSPHLLDFRERIRVNGDMITEEFVTQFVEDSQGSVSCLAPSFFELTTMMAFEYFRLRAVDVAIIEVGLGGRLDSTNIVSPILSIITNVSLDHTEYLGDTLTAIADEKAGIIKPNIPIIIGNASDPEVRKTFEANINKASAPVIWAQETGELTEATLTDVGYIYYTKTWGVLHGELMGLVQPENTATILATLCALRPHFTLTMEAVRGGFAKVSSLTGLQGRWQTVDKNPRIICDTAHNPAGIAQVVAQIGRMSCCYTRMHIVFGMAEDKDVESVLNLLPSSAAYYFTQARSGRAMPAERLAELAATAGLQGNHFSSVADALRTAKAMASPSDLIFVGGSNFIVADLLAHLNQEKKNN